MSNSALKLVVNNEESSLEKLQESTILKKPITVTDITEALTEDVSRQIPICLVHFTRFVAQSDLVTQEDLELMIKILGKGMTSTLTKDPDIFLSYARAATICAKKL